jgi:hypothetical protein
MTGGRHAHDPASVIVLIAMSTESGKNNAVDQVETSSLEIFTTIEDSGFVIVGYVTVSYSSFMSKLMTYLECLGG